MFEHMKTTLTSASGDAVYPEDIRNAAKIALLKLEKYYKLARENQFYTIATGKLDIQRLSPYSTISAALREH